MKLFVPHVQPSETEAEYAAIVASVKSQFRLPIADRKIARITYTNSKHKWRAEVGQREEQEDKYEIVAILESKSFIVVTRMPDGAPGVTIMVNPAEVTEVVEFDA